MWTHQDMGPMAVVSKCIENAGLVSAGNFLRS